MHVGGGTRFQVRAQAATPAAPTVPSAPQRLLAVGLQESVRLGWFDPDNDGGDPISSYTIRDATGLAVTVTDDPTTLPGLAPGVARVFTVSATNSIGEGQPSALSNVVTPHPLLPGPRWQTTGALAQARNAAGVARLKDGRVLVVGGGVQDPNLPDPTLLASAELYDSASGTWSSTGPLPTALVAFELTVLRSGRVLLTGGVDASFQTVDLAFQYDPAKETWTQVAAMSKPRVGHTATRLPGGNVLVAGGFTMSSSGRGVTATTEIYQPDNGQWTATGQMTRRRKNHLAVRLAGSPGRVLVVGGDAGAEGTRSAEIYHAATGHWSTTGSMRDVRGNDDIGQPTAVRLTNGKVLIAGGYRSAPLRSAELYDPAKGKWLRTGRMIVARQGGHMATRMPGGAVLIAGGTDDFGGLRAAELYVPVTGTWELINDLGASRTGHVSALMDDGSVLIAGGTGFDPYATLASAESYH